MGNNQYCSVADGSSEQTRLDDEQHRWKIYHYMLTELLHHVIWRLDLKTMRVLEVSSSVKELRGYEPEEVIGRGLDEVLTPSSYSRLTDILLVWLDSLPVFAGGALQTVEALEQPCQDGTTVWTEMAIYLFRRKDGGTEAVGISRQLGAQKNLADMCQQLMERERFLQVIWDAAPCFLSCVDRDGNYLQINQQYADFWKINRSKVQERHFTEVIAPELCAKHERLLAECLQGRRVEFLDQCREPGSGKTKTGWAYGAYTPVFSPDGKVKQAVVAVMDVTEQYEMKEQLSEAEKFGKTGSWKINLLNKKFTCSEGVLELYALSREEVEKRSYMALCSRSRREEVEQVIAKFQAMIAEGREQLVEDLLLIMPGGIKRWVRLSAFMRKDQDGKPLELLGRVEDITRQRALEDVERDAALRLREFSRTMPGAGMIVDLTGMIVEIFDNNHLLQSACSGRNLSDLLPKDTAERLTGAIECAVSRDMLQFTECVLNMDEEEKFFDVRIAPLSYRWEGKETVACYLTDVTDQIRTKQMLKMTYIKRRQRDLLNDLVEGKMPPSPEVLDQAWQVKLNLTQDFSCYLIVLKTWAGRKIEAGRWQENLQDATLEKVIVRLAEEESGTIAWESKEGIAVLVPVKPGQAREQSEEIRQAERWQIFLHRNIPEAECIIGIAEFHSETFWRISQLYEQARTAVELGEKTAPEKKVHHYLEIGVFQLFPDVFNSENAKNFVQRTLGKLEEYDLAHDTDLVDTLAKILQTNNLSQVAKELYVHRQTILFRKRRIETVLGVELDDFETKLTLGMALKFRQALGSGG